MMLTGVLLIAAGALGFAPEPVARAAWVCVFLAGLFLIVGVHI